jgi:hypothetical protein
MEVLQLDIITAIWQCFEYGFYSHGETVSLINHPEVHNILPFVDAPLNELCADIALELR